MMRRRRVYVPWHQKEVVLVCGLTPCEVGKSAGGIGAVRDSFSWFSTDPTLIKLVRQLEEKGEDVHGFRLYEDCVQVLQYSVLWDEEGWRGGIGGGIAPAIWLKRGRPIKVVWYNF